MSTCPIIFFWKQRAVQQRPVRYVSCMALYISFIYYIGHIHEVLNMYRLVYILRTLWNLIVKAWKCTITNLMIEIIITAQWHLINKSESSQYMYWAQPGHYEFIDQPSTKSQKLNRNKVYGDPIGQNNISIIKLCLRSNIHSHTFKGNEILTVQ